MIATLALARFKVPTISVLLIVGAVLGPYGLRAIDDAHGIEALAEAGVMFLLFTIGLEFSLERLMRMGRTLVLGGTLQVVLTIALFGALSVLFGVSTSKAILFGFLATLSSTAIVLRLLADRVELDSPHGRFIVGVLVFQDICVVPMMLLVPVLAGEGNGNPLWSAVSALARAAAVVVVTFAVARWGAPRIFRAIDRTGSREVFLMTVLVLCVGTAWLTSLAGLSLALGAFLAGIVLADSEYSHRALGNILPIRDLLTTFFFVSLGMLFDARLLFERPLFLIGSSLALILGKGLIGAVAARVLRLPWRIAILGGLGLAQFGEFGFVLARSASETSLLPPDELRLLLGPAVLTMLVTPLLFRIAPAVANAAGGLSSARGPSSEPVPHAGHVVIVGFGIAGRILSGALRKAGVEYVIYELNGDTVRAGRVSGEPIHYADIATPDAIAHAHVASARALVLLINDPAATKRAVAMARKHASETPIIVRTRYARDVERLKRLGANDVVVEEVETGMVLSNRVLALI